MLIKFKEATECCVTNGAEVKVVDWISYTHPLSKKKMLKTLFVELQDPPTPIKLDGLPKNVVPISPDSRAITCDLPDGSTLQINRSQIPVIPNFAMTDYCSQGRTRPFNVVHLNHCRTHQSYYTCLSRSATHDGTLILNSFNSHVIISNANKGLSGNLRQEFRELELLDDISKLRFEGVLPLHVNGNIRRDVITQYREWKGGNHVPDNVHVALQWSKRSPFLLSSCPNTKWEIVESNQNRKTMPLPLPVGHKKLTGYIPVQSTKQSLPNKTAVLSKTNKVKKLEALDTYSTLVDFNSTKKYRCCDVCCNIFYKTTPSNPTLTSFSANGNNLGCTELVMFI